MRDSLINATTESKKQFSIRTLMLATLIVAWTLAVNSWLGEGYGWRTAIPCGLIAGFVLLVSFQTAIGCVIGSFILAVIGYLFIVGHTPPSPEFFKAMLIVSAFGGAAGCSLHAIALRYWKTGLIAFLISTVAFIVILKLN